MNGWTVSRGWRLVLGDVGLRPDDVLRRAGLPGDLFAREKASLSTDEYFALWRGVEEEARDPLIPLRIGSSISVEAFDPPVFAALCSPDLNAALERISRYKRLVLPMVLRVEVGRRATSLELEWLNASMEPPQALVHAELAFFVNLGRLGTRAEIRPLEVRAPRPPEPRDAYARYLGVPVQEGPRPRIVFRAEDAARPFLTANERTWRFFEPELQRRLSELDETATASDRVQAALLELLPGGTASIEAVSRKLGASSRTLQRRLQQEGQTFQRVLQQTREGLARHYLKSSRLSGAEISFLLGFEDPNSFFRAFHGWTGTTPEQARGAPESGR